MTNLREIKEIVERKYNFSCFYGEDGRTKTLFVDTNGKQVNVRFENGIVRFLGFEFVVDVFNYENNHDGFFIAVHGESVRIGFLTGIKRLIEVIRP